jgi:thymidylate synthase (FAD)
MSHSIKVLDHGFVTLRNLAGPTRRSHNPDPRVAADGTAYDIYLPDFKQFRDFDADDTDVANSARMSFAGTDVERSYQVEMKLNRYLMANKHMTPFESIEVWLEMKLPIFVARQFVRHRTASLNEVSGRYVTLPAEWYIPEVVGGKPVDRKQGQSDTLSALTQWQFRQALDKRCGESYAEYLHWMEEGVAPEHARMFLHLNHYTHWLWKQNLRNLMHFLALRQHSHAQVEAQAYANATVALLEPQLPGLMALYAELVKLP